MKKLFSLVLVLSLGALLVAGCNSTTSGGGDPTIPASTVAGDVAQMGKNSLALDNGILGVISVAGVAGTKAMAPADLARTGDWFTATDSFPLGSLTIDVTYNFRVWGRSDGLEIVTVPGLAAIHSSGDLNALWTYTTITYTFSGGSYSISYGDSTSDPLKWTYSATTGSISGPISFSSSYSGTSYGITITYGALTTTSSGYPSGTVTVSITESGSVVGAGSIVFDGTTSAVVTFTSGYSGSYTVNLDTGAVSSAGL